MREVRGALLLEPGEIDLLGRAASAVADLAGHFGGGGLPQAVMLAALGRAVQALTAGERPPVFAMLAPTTSTEARRLARYLAGRSRE
ncbi:MAG TPA: hypothetical protein VNM16_10735, partial [Bacillota bacterium]|nr:hypothetical protein [Bacillota bacterium]